jgi:hypothetical protein
MQRFTFYKIQCNQSECYGTRFLTYGEACDYCSHLNQKESKKGTTVRFSVATEHIQVYETAESKINADNILLVETALRKLTDDEIGALKEAFKLL